MSEAVERLADRLTGAGLEHAFGITGSGPSWRLITALEARGVRYHQVHHEASAAIMAGVASHASGKPSAAIAIKGPGLANLLPGIAANHFEGYPALSIAEAYGPAVPSFRKHKRLDQPRLLAALVKGALGLEDAATRVGDLLRVARAEPPGPVHVALADDAADLPGPPVPAVPDEANVGRALRAIEEMEQPLVIVGALAGRRAWGARLRDLGCPILTTVAAKGVVDERAPYAAGVYTGAGKTLAPERTLLDEADGVVTFGVRNTELLGFPQLPEPTVVLDEIDLGLSAGLGATDAVLDADDSVFTRALDRLAGSSWGADVVARTDRHLRRGVQTDWLPATCFAHLDQAELDHALVLDTGSFCTLGEHLWRARPGERIFLGSSHGRSMGVGLPSAIGLAIARPGLPVVCAVGDGGIGMYLAELKTAVAKRLPLLLVLMRDGRYGSIACADPTGALSPGAVTMDRPSWRDEIAGFGVETMRAGDAASFAEAVSSWDRETPRYVECVFDPAPYATMTEELR